jgi:hypothetical protein
MEQIEPDSGAGTFGALREEVWRFFHPHRDRLQQFHAVISIFIAGEQ